VAGLTGTKTQTARAEVMAEHVLFTSPAEMLLLAATAVAATTTNLPPATPLPIVRRLLVTLLQLIPRVPLIKILLCCVTAVSPSMCLELERSLTFACTCLRRKPLRPASPVCTAAPVPVPAVTRLKSKNPRRECEHLDLLDIGMTEGETWNIACDQCARTCMSSFCVCRCLSVCVNLK